MHPGWAPSLSGARYRCWTAVGSQLQLDNCPWWQVRELLVVPSRLRDVGMLSSAGRQSVPMAIALLAFTVTAVALAVTPVTGNVSPRLVSISDGEFLHFSDARAKPLSVAREFLADPSSGSADVSGTGCPRPSDEYTTWELAREAAVHSGVGPEAILMSGRSLFSQVFDSGFCPVVGASSSVGSIGSAGNA